MKIIEKASKNVFEIHPKGSPVQERLLCPVCSANRKKKTEKVLVWNNRDGIGLCHNCQAAFFKEKPFEYKSISTRIYKTPTWENNTDISDKVVKWFEGRGISQFTLRHMKVTSGAEWMPQLAKEVETIHFNYFRDEKLINIKYRDSQKNFKFFKDAELIFYNLNGIKESNEIYIVEGEIDALTLYECGKHNVISVPNGANVGRNNFDYIDNCIGYFETADKIILATDADVPGINLRTQLATRFGIEKCYTVDFLDCKDANEFMLKYGKEKCIEILNNCKSFPIEGVYSASDFKDDLFSLYENGLQPGMKINVDGLDSKISFELGRLYTVTGIPGHGKSEFVDFIIERLNIEHALKVGYFSPENHPLQLHASKIIEKLTGVKFSKKTMDMQTFESAYQYVEDNFFFIEPPEDYKVDTILEKARALVFQKGIKILVLDPYNKFEHNMVNGESETNYISKFLDKIITFAKRNNIIIFLIAHPRKMQKLTNGLHDVPSLYDINGSANFFNKTDFGITVYRNMMSNVTDVYIQKVKFKHLGEIGSTSFVWNKQNGRYSTYDGGDFEDVIYDNSCHLKSEGDQHYSDPLLFTTEEDVPF